MSHIDIDMNVNDYYDSNMNNDGANNELELLEDESDNDCDTTDEHESDNSYIEQHATPIK